MPTRAQSRSSLFIERGKQVSEQKTLVRGEAIPNRGNHNRQSFILSGDSASMWHQNVASEGQAERSVTRADRRYDKAVSKRAPDDKETHCLRRFGDCSSLDDSAPDCSYQGLFVSRTVRPTRTVRPEDCSSRGLFIQPNLNDQQIMLEASNDETSEQ